MEITYHTDIIPTAEQVVELYKSAGMPRPVDDPERIRKMYENSNLVVTAWHGEQLVGASRSLTDWVWCCYLSDLAVHADYMKSGIGRRLIDLTKEKIGDQSMLLLLSVPTAMDYYPKSGFEKQENGFLYQRKY